MVAKNPAGFLRKSIEDDYADPVDFVSKEERERQAQKAAAQQKQQEWRKKMEDYKFWLEAKPEHMVFWDLRQWEKRYEEEQGRKPTKEEVSAQQEKLIKGLPTNTEKQMEIFGKVVFREGTLEPLDKSTDPNLGSG
jgi:FMN phosphatase YigB (HAD superfamily)